MENSEDYQKDLSPHIFQSTIARIFSEFFKFSEEERNLNLLPWIRAVWDAWINREEHETYLWRDASIWDRIKSVNDGLLLNPK